MLTVYLIYFTADKGIQKKKKEINFMIYSISKKLRDRLLLVFLLGEGTQYLQSAVLINRLLLTIKRGAHFSFGPWHVIYAAVRPLAEQQRKAPWTRQTLGRSCLPAPSSPRTQLPASRIYGFGISSPWLPRVALQFPPGKSICATFFPASPLLKVGEKLKGAREHKKRADA